jgi:ankyrin repeat protein
MPALAYAASLGNLGVARCLVKELGADVNQVDHIGCTPLHWAVGKGDLAMLRCLVKELGADVGQASAWSTSLTPLHFAAQEGNIAVLRCLVNELGADVNKGEQNGATPLYIAAQVGKMAVVQCLVKDLNADVNQAKLDGGTPLMVAAAKNHGDLVRWLVKAGADTQAFPAIDGSEFTAAYFSKSFDASAEQTAYLEAKTHCSHPGCSGAGLKKCTGCRKARYCGGTCQLAHWKAHKADCRRWSAELATEKDL